MLHNRRLPLVLDLDLTLIHAMFKKDLDKAAQGEWSKKGKSTLTGVEQPRMPSPDDWGGHTGNTGPATGMANAIRAGRDPDAGEAEASRAQQNNAVAKQMEVSLKARKHQATNLQAKLAEFHHQTHKNPNRIRPSRGCVWDTTHYFMTRCTVLGSADPKQLYPFLVAMRPGINEFVEQLSSPYELFIYTNGMRPYVEEVIRCTPLHIIPKKNTKCREQLTDGVQKSVPLVCSYSRGLVVVVDDCEGKPSAERVWPKDAHRVVVIQAYDCLAPTSAKSNPSSALDTVRRMLLELHQEFFAKLDQMHSRLQHKEWLDIALGNTNAGSKEDLCVPSVVDMINRRRRRTSAFWL